MKRRSFLQGLCGLLGVAASPVLLAKPIAEAYVLDDPMLSGFSHLVTGGHVPTEPIISDKIAIPRGGYHHQQYGYRAVLDGNTMRIERI